jgi:peptidyl-prolyl cis-trans isomerase SurA
MINLKPVHFLLLAIICFGSIAQAQTPGKTIDKIVAQVGDNIVLYSELQGQKRAMMENGVPITENTECELIEQMLYQFLLVNQAELDSVVISDEQIDAETENRIRAIEAKMKGQYDENGDPITFESYYGKSKNAVKQEFRDAIGKRMKGQEVERGITGAISVSPREVELFFNSIPKDSLPYINSQLTFQQIGIFPVITREDKERRKKELEELRTRIVNKRISFRTAAIQLSDDLGTAQFGGRIEATLGQMVPSFEQTALSLRPGEISQVFQSEYGYHIMEMVELKGDDYIVNHILFSVKPSTESENEAAIKMEECYKALLANEITWEQAVVKYSNDRNKENNGFIMNPYTGELKWSIENINQVDPEMFILTDALEKNQISSPMIFTDFMERTKGFRIVRLNDRTQPHIANLTDDYDLFRSLAEEKKKNDAILAWINSRMNTAYIRIDKDYDSCVFHSDWTHKNQGIK